MNIYVWSTKSFEHAAIAHAAGLWAFEVEGWRPGNIVSLDKQCAKLAVNDIAVLYCAGRGIVMIGHVSGKSLPGTEISGLWNGNFRCQVPVTWWNSPTVITKEVVKREIPIIRRRGNTENWQLYLGVNPRSFFSPPSGIEFKKNIHDVFYLIDNLPVDTSIRKVRELLQLRSTIPAELYGPLLEKKRVHRKRIEKDEVNKMPEQNLPQHPQM